MSFQLPSLMFRSLFSSCLAHVWPKADSFLLEMLCSPGSRDYTFFISLLLTSCYLDLFVGSSSSESSGGWLSSRLSSLLPHHLLPRCFIQFMTFPGSTLKWIVPAQMSPLMHTCMASNSLFNILTGVLNRHLSVSQTEPIFFLSLHFLYLSSSQWLAGPFFLGIILDSSSLTLTFNMQPIWETCWHYLQNLVTSHHLYCPTLVWADTMSHWGDCKRSLTDLPDSILPSYNLLSTQQPERPLKNELLDISPLLKPFQWTLISTRG